MNPRDPAGTVRRNAEDAARDRAKTEAGERLIGRDAVALFCPDLSLSSGDPALTSELLFGAGNEARDLLRSAAARLAFVRGILLQSGISESDLFPVLTGRAPLRVLYARIGAADRAYRLVSTVLSDPRVGYAETNSDAAEGVEAGDADLTLLPYADAAGNPVLSTEALSETHGLYLVALAHVRVGTGLTYGLYGRAILPNASGRTTLHLSFPTPDAETAAELFAFSRGAGLRPDGAAFPPTGRASLALSGRREDCLAAAVYALCFIPGCEFRGWRDSQPLSER